MGAWAMRALSSRGEARLRHAAQFDGETAIAAHSALRAGLHPRGSTDHLEIGYWIRTDATGNGFAVEAARAMTVAGFAATNVERLEIHCDAENGRSAAVARRLGFELTRTIREGAVTARGESRNTLVWTLRRKSDS